MLKKFKDKATVRGFLSCFLCASYILFCEPVHAEVAGLKLNLDLGSLAWYLVNLYTLQ